MNWWDDLTNPINKALNSTPFKVAFPVQALAQAGTQAATGLNPANQYAAGAAGGSAIAGGSALMGGGAGHMAPFMPTSAPNMGAAGSTLGGGMGSPLNLGASGGMAGAGQAGASGGPMSAVQLLSSMRGSGQPQAGHEPTQNLLERIYQMFPHLRPSFGSQGGMYGA